MHLQLLTEIRECGPADLVADAALDVEASYVGQGFEERLDRVARVVRHPQRGFAVELADLRAELLGQVLDGGRIGLEGLGGFTVFVAEPEQAVFLGTRHSATVTDPAEPETY